MNIQVSKLDLGERVCKEWRWMELAQDHA